MKICLVTSFPPSRRGLNEYGFHIARELQRDPLLSVTILSLIRRVDPTSLNLRKQLHAVANTQYRHSRAKNRVLKAGGASRIDTVGPSG